MKTNVIKLSKVNKLFIQELGGDHITDHYYAIISVRGELPTITKGTLTILDKRNNIYSIKCSYAAALELNIV